jgi:hypothetical protein
VGRRFVPGAGRPRELVLGGQVVEVLAVRRQQVRRGRGQGERGGCVSPLLAIHVHLNDHNINRRFKEYPTCTNFVVDDIETLESALASTL